MAQSRFSHNWRDRPLPADLRWQGAGQRGGGDARRWRGCGGSAGECCLASRGPDFDSTVERGVFPVSAQRGPRRRALERGRSQQGRGPDRVGGCSAWRGGRSGGDNNFRSGARCGSAELPAAATSRLTRCSLLQAQQRRERRQPPLQSYLRFSTRLNSPRARATSRCARGRARRRCPPNGSNDPRSQQHRRGCPTPPVLIGHAASFTPY